MDVLVLLIQLVFTIPLFFINEYFNKKNISSVQKIFIPVVYIIILAGLLGEIKSNIYLIVIFEFILHDFYINNIANTNILVNKKEYFIDSIISIVASIFVYEYYISKVTNILPEASEFRGLLWFLIIVFVYELLKDNITKVENNNKVSFIERKREYVVVMYAKFKNRYYSIVKSETALINRLIYAIMIYENYRNPIINRKFMNIINRFTNRDSKYGIMQVESSHELTDIQSIELMKSILEDSYSKLNKKLEEKEMILKLLQDKYSDQEYINDICDVYFEIKTFESR